MTKFMNENPYNTSTADYLDKRPNVIILSLLIVAVVFGMLLPLVWCGYQDTHYETTAKVYSVDDAGTLFIDGAGYLWEVYDTDYKVGEFVTLTFDNNMTDYTRNDDIITKVKTLDN